MNWKTRDQITTIDDDVKDAQPSYKATTFAFPVNQYGHNLYSCPYGNHRHTSLGLQECRRIHDPLEFCKFHDNVAACRYYCRYENEKKPKL